MRQHQVLSSCDSGMLVLNFAYLHDLQLMMSWLKASASIAA